MYIVVSDCRISSLWRRFPGLFQGQTTEQPHNFTATYFEREALELGGLLDYFYPGITVKFYPAYESKNIHCATTSSQSSRCVDGDTTLFQLCVPLGTLYYINMHRKKYLSPISRRS